MVLYKRDIKRKYAGASTSIHCIPKRAKVQAQRKFAQGLSCNNVADKSFTKEKGKVKPNGNTDPTPLLSANRPKTEDFLTFLCYRNTCSLPPRLNFFDSASEPGHSPPGPSTSNQSNEIMKAKKERIGAKHSAVKIHPNKFKQKKPHTSASRIDNVNMRSGRRGKVRRQAVAVRRTPRSVSRRPLNSAIRSRLGEKRIRGGLRSGGVLPAGSDAGLSSFRRPRSCSSGQTLTYPVRKSAIPLGDSTDEDDEEEVQEETDEEVGKDNRKRVTDEKQLTTRTRSSSLKSHPSPSHRLKKLPTRKTKEAAAAYMEILNKSLRKSDVDSDSYDEAEDPARLEKVRKKGRLSLREVNISKKAIPTKALPGRSLKDKSLKRAPLATQRKIMMKNLRIKRIEEVSKRRTRSRTEAENMEKQEIRRTRGSHNKMDQEEPHQEEQEKLKQVEDKVEVIKKADVKSNVRKEPNVNPPTERRSRRLVKDEEVLEADQNNTVRDKDVKKPTRRSTALSPRAENPQLTRTSRKSSSTLKPITKTQSAREFCTKNSPSRRRSFEPKKEKPEVETPIVISRRNSKKDTSEDMSPVGTRRSLSKKEINSEIKETNCSPSRLRSMIKTIKKEEKNDSELKVTCTTNQRLSRSSMRNEEKVDNTSFTNQSPTRLLRNVHTLEKNSSQDDSSKNKLNTSIANKKAAEDKGKLVVTKEEKNLKDEDKKMPLCVEQPTNKTRKTGRSCGAANKKKELEKQDHVATPAPIEAKKTRSSTCKKPDQPSDTSPKQHQDDKNVKLNTSKQSFVRVKHISELCSENNNVKTQGQSKNHVDKTGNLDLAVVKEDFSKSKYNSRKKSSSCFSEEEPSQKEAPKKKLKESQNNSLLFTNVATCSEPKVALKDEGSYPFKNKKDFKKEDAKKMVSEPVKAALDKDNNKCVQNNMTVDSKMSNPIPKSTLTAVNLITQSREGSMDKLDEKDLLKGFDEVNAKEMENKVDKFIEQMILKTSDDESKSKMRSRYKQTGVTKDVARPKSNKPNKDTAERSAKANISKQSSEAPSGKEQVIKEAPKVKCDVDMMKKVTSPVECVTLEPSKRGRKKKSKLASADQDNNGSELEDVSKKYKQDDKFNQPQKSGKEATKEKSNDNKVKMDLSDNEDKNNVKETNHLPDMKPKELGISVNVTVTENKSPQDGGKVNQKRKFSSETNPSALKIKTQDSKRGARSKGNSAVQDKVPTTKLPDVKSANKEKTKKIEASEHRDSSDSEDEPLSKRSAKLKRIKKKNSPNTKQTKKGMRELKALDTSEVPLRTSRARVAKHAGSSFYYETDSSSHYSSSEEEISVKIVKTIAVSKKPDGAVVNDSLASPKEDMTTQTDETKDFPRDTQPVINCQLTSVLVPPSPFNNSPLIDEKKLLEMPVDYEFESEYESSLLVMYPNYKLPKNSRDQELTPEDVRNIVKDIKANVGKPGEQAPSTSSVSIAPLATEESVESSNVNRPLPQGIKVLSPENKLVTACEPNSMYDEARTSMDLLASVAEDISARMKNSPILRPSLCGPLIIPSSSIPSPSVNTLITPPTISNLSSTNVSSLSSLSSIVDKSPSCGGNGTLVEENKPPTEESKVPEEEARIPLDKRQTCGEENKVSTIVTEKVDPPKSKPKTSSIGQTWIQAFKNAKIPKPGQLTPLSHSVKPFVRKPFLSQPFVSKNNSPLKSDTPDTKFKPFDRSSLVKPLSLTTSSPVKQVCHPFKINPSNSSSSLQVKAVTQNKMKDVKNIQTPKVSLNIPTPRPNVEIKKEVKIDSVQHKPLLPKPHVSTTLAETLLFQPVEVKSEDLNSKPKIPSQLPRVLDSAKKVDIAKGRDSPGGKHQNLPLAVEHTLRRMSPVAVSRKPPPSPALKPHIPSKDTKDSNNIDQSKSNRSSPSSSKSSWLWKSEKFLSDSVVTKVSDLEILAKKRVIMTSEEIEKWLDDSTSTAIEHSKDCGLFEKNQCECSFRTSGTSMQNSVTVLSDHSTKIGSCIVEPPMQLKDIEPKCTAETISTCKVEDYKEKLIAQTPAGMSKEISVEDKKEVANYSSSKPMQPPTPGKQEKAWKSTRSMTEEEMCEFDFRFERNSNSPRESVSDMSSPTLKDEMSSSNDEGIGSQSEKKSIFHKNNRPLSKSPCAFNAENESSVYAFEPDSDLPVSRPLFRRKNKTVKEESEKNDCTAVSTDADEVLKSSEEVSIVQVVADTTATQSPMKEEDVAQTKSPPKEKTKKVTKKKSESGTKVPDSPLSPSSTISRRSNPRRGSSESVSEKRALTRCEQRMLKRSADELASSCHHSVAPSTSSKSSQSTYSSATPSKKVGSPASKAPLQPLPSKSHKESGFPQVGVPARLVEAPAFYPSEKEFSDPLEYLQKITPEAEHFGICRIVPPPSFKPECKVSDEMRFTSYNQYVHKMMKRWGPSVKEMEALRKFLATQNIFFTHPPWVGGIEIDLPRLYQTVQECGGLKEVMEKKRWTKVADSMRIPKLSQDRATKLDDIYCKYLLPYETLAPELREKWLEQAESEWIEKEKKLLTGTDKSAVDSQDDSLFECITKGRSMPLSQFFRIARNTFGMWFGNDKSPPTERIEAEYWNHVTERNYHVCVNSGSIDCGTWGYGFPTAKNSNTAKHPWNLKVLTNHPHSVLRSLPPLMGVTVPTLHVGMLFSTFCWYRDPHGLPWIEYLHTGAKKVWYGVPDQWTNELRAAIKSVLPSIVRESPVWLPSDTAMLSPQLLLDKGVSLCRTVQEPGQFIVIFPKAYTSAFCTGYLVSESVYYAPSSWLATAELLFKEVKDSCEPTMFSLEKLLFFIANDTRTSLEILQQVVPMMEGVMEKEMSGRKALERVGLEERSKLAKPAKRSSNSQPHDYECNTCNCSLFVSLVKHKKEDVCYCLTDALDLFTKQPDEIDHCQLLYIYDEEEMKELVEEMKGRIEVKVQKKNNKKT